MFGDDDDQPEMEGFMDYLKFVLGFFAVCSPLLVFFIVEEMDATSLLATLRVVLSAAF